MLQREDDVPFLSCIHISRDTDRIKSMEYLCFSQRACRFHCLEERVHIDEKDDIWSTRILAYKKTSLVQDQDWRLVDLLSMPQINARATKFCIAAVSQFSGWFTNADHVKEQSRSWVDVNALPWLEDVFVACLKSNMAFSNRDSSFENIIL